MLKIIDYLVLGVMHDAFILDRSKRITVRPMLLNISHVSNNLGFPSYLASITKLPFKTAFFGWVTLF